MSFKSLTLVPSHLNEEKLFISSFRTKLLIPVLFSLISSQSFRRAFINLSILKEEKSNTFILQTEKLVLDTFSFAWFIITLSQKVLK